jgi:predicted nucleic acid-binding protein
VGAVSVYLDASVLVPLFVIDPLNERADKALQNLSDSLVVSDFSAAEFSSVMARRVRTRELRGEEAQVALLNFDTWCARYASLVDLESADVKETINLLRRFDLSLRTPDAFHIAIAKRAHCKLLTFDRNMGKAARELGIELIKA